MMATDPRYGHRLLMIGILCIGGLVVLAAGWFALAPLPGLPDYTAPTITHDERPGSPGTASIDPSIWEVRFWTPLQEQTRAATAAPTAAPFRGDLAAILQRGERRIAAIVLGDGQTVFLAEGEQHEQMQVLSIVGDAVTIEEHGRRHRLELR